MPFKNMKNSLKFSLYLLLVACGIGITKKTFSPDIKSHTNYSLTELNEMNFKRAEEEKRQFIIKELNKPVLDFYAPVDTGQISCVYGFRKEKTEFHKGIDIGILGNASLKFAERPDILAAAPGIVDFADYETGYGKVVKIKHKDSLETIYAHLNNFFVEKGDSVLAQQKIGEMGRSGKVRSDKKRSKIHLHFEARRNNKPFNPDKYFKGYEKVRIDDTLCSSIAYLPVENVKQLEKINSNKTLKSFYEIQVGASLNPLSKSKIKALEKLYDNPIKENKTNILKNGKDKIYYKYSINQFKTLEEALGFRNSLNSKNKLGIIVYKNDKVVETKWKF